MKIIETAIAIAWDEEPVRECDGEAKAMPVESGQMERTSTVHTIF